MNSFIDLLTEKIIHFPQKKIVIQDVDSIFQYSEVKEKFKELDYELYFYIDPVSFRIDYELKIKSELKNNDNLKYIIIIDQHQTFLEDILAQSELLKISFNDFYPHLNNMCLRGLQLDELDQLLLLTNMLFQTKNYNETVKFLFEKLFRIDLDSLDCKEALIARLMTIHARKLALNNELRKKILELINSYIDTTADLLSKNEFNIWLKEQWDNYVFNDLGLLNFNHPQLFDTLRLCFIGHQIEPCKVTNERFNEIRLREGVYYDAQEQIKIDYKNILRTVSDLLSPDKFSTNSWGDIVSLMSIAFNYLLETEVLDSDVFFNLETEINNKFQEYIDNHYASLFSKSSYIRPSTVTQILKHIEYHKEENKKIALIVIDGMNFWQWKLIQQSITETNVNYQIDENVCLAWIPTITSLSRQAIFKGNIPSDDYNQNPANEKKAWNLFWQERYAPENEIEYESFNHLVNINDYNFSDIKYLALVTNDLDDEMHGTYRGNKNLHGNTVSWILDSKIIQLIKKLVDDDFCIYIASDHGNVEATGWRNLKASEKFGTSKSRSKRHLEYKQSNLLDEFIENNPGLEGKVGTKNNIAYLKNKSAFILKDNKVITHGGSHFWEVLTPFIKVTKSNDKEN